MRIVVHEKEYRARKGYHYTNADAQIIGPVLDALASQHGGKVIPIQVVEAAEAEDSPLHPYFDWDNVVASGKWREHQSRNMLGAIEIKVTVKEGGRTAEEFVRNFHNVIEVGEKGEESERVYMSLEQIATREELIEQVVTRAAAEVHAWYKRYQTYAHLEIFQRRLGDVIEAITRAQRAS